MNVSPRLVLAVLVLAPLVAASCRRPSATSPAPEMNQDSIDAENARRDALARLEQMRQDSLARERARLDSINNAGSRGNRMTEEARETIRNPVYFEFDRSDLSQEDQGRLDAKIPILNANASLRIRAAGHTDSRGSDEYNLALGQRRAAAAKRYLVQHGIDGSRVETVSFGEERPAASGADESAMAQNRRTEFEIIAGGDNLVLPSGL
jgi:peptidoglycan-associated lipoprotein